MFNVITARPGTTGATTGGLSADAGGLCSWRRAGWTESVLMRGRGSSDEGAVIDTAPLRRRRALAFRTGILKGERGAFQRRFVSTVIIVVITVILGGGRRCGGIERRSILARSTGSVHEADGIARIRYILDSEAVIGTESWSFSHVVYE